MSDGKGRVFCCSKCGSFDLQGDAAPSFVPGETQGVYVICRSCCAVQRIKGSDEFKITDVIEKGRNVDGV